MKESMRKKNTPTYHFYNANPKGLYTGDCTYRAYALANGISWEVALMTCALYYIKTGKIDCDANDTDELLQEFGTWIRHKEPKHYDGKKYTVAQLAEELMFEPDPVIVTVNNHTTCIKNGKVWDTWNCSGEYVRAYWTKGKAR